MPKPTIQGLMSVLAVIAPPLMWAPLDRNSVFTSKVTEMRSVTWKSMPA